VHQGCGRSVTLDTHRAGVASRPAVVAEVIVRHPLGPVLLTEYGSLSGQQEQPSLTSG
jgi:predicted TIM-barrel fold metal-dependent hydrolase